MKYEDGRGGNIYIPDEEDKILVSSVLLKHLQIHLNEGYKIGYKPLQIIKQDEENYLIIFIKEDKKI